MYNKNTYNDWIKIINIQIGNIKYIYLDID